MSDADLMITGLANIFGVDREKLANEIDGPSALATIARQLLDIDRVARTAGRPPAVDRNWQRYVAVSMLEKQLGSVDAAIAYIIARDGGENTKVSRVSSLRRAYTRWKKKWGSWDNIERPDGLAGLFVDPPANGQN